MILASQEELDSAMELASRLNRIAKGNTSNVVIAATTMLQGDVLDKLQCEPWDKQFVLSVLIAQLYQFALRQGLSMDDIAVSVGNVLNATEIVGFMDAAKKTKLN